MGRITDKIVAKFLGFKVKDITTMHWPDDTVMVSTNWGVTPYIIPKRKLRKFINGRNNERRVA